MSISPVIGQAEPSPEGRDPFAPTGPAGIQPHGLVLVVREGPLRIVQASTSAGHWLQRPLASLLLATLHDLGGDIAARVAALAGQGVLDEPQPLHCSVGAARESLRFEGAAVRVAVDTLLVELQPAADASGALGATLLQALAGRAERFATAANMDDLAQVAADAFRTLFGHDRATFSRCNEDDGALAVMAESLAGALPPLQRQAPHAHALTAPERRLALRNRSQACADLRAPPSDLVPRLLPGGPGDGSGAPDLTMCGLRCPTPAQALLWQAQGAVGTLRVAVVREGRLWGVVDCHHAQPLPLDYGARMAAELLAEVLATRAAALDGYARAQAMAWVHRLEERLLDATADEGDWRRALLRDVPALLQPMGATGAVLQHEGEWLCCGETPDPGLLAPLLAWLRQGASDRARQSRRLPAESQDLAALAPQACGVLAVPLTTSGNGWLVWLRAARGDATEAAAWDDDQLSLAGAIGRMLVDLIVQVNAVRLLIAQRQLAQVRGAVAEAQEAVVVVDAGAQAFYANAAFYALAGRGRDECSGLAALAELFTEPTAAHRMMGQVRAEQRPWQGELLLRHPGGTTLPVAVRAEPVPGQDGTLLGTIFIFQDLTATKHAEAARSRFEAQLARAGRSLGGPGSDELARAILANASLAGMDISEGGAPPAVASLLAEVQASAERAAALLARIRRSGGG